MKSLEDALAYLDLSIDTLEDAAANRLAHTARNKRTPSGKAMAADDIGSLFSTEQLTNVKARLDDAIERLESALEVADGAH